MSFSIGMAALAHPLIGFLIIAVLTVSLLLTLQSAYTLYLMFYTWDQPAVYQKAQAPSDFLPAQLSFTILLPARHEEEVIQTTIERVVRANYPPSLLEVIVVCAADDTGTIARAQEKIDQVRAAGRDNVRVVSFTDPPVNKPHALNVGLRSAHHDVVTIFDAEDDIHPDLFQIVNTLMLKEEVPVVQCGVQLMNYQTTWYSALNVLEYFFWFKSRLHYHAQRGLIPLGGNTVFFTRALLERVQGWDEQNLTEDADMGIRISCLGEHVRVVYDDRYVTREETPPTLRDFIRQRTRWNQGFLQTLLKGEWQRLPKLSQRVLALYTLGLPAGQAVIGCSMFVALAMWFLMKTPTPLALLAMLPFYVLLAHLVLAVLGLYEFTEAHGLKPSPKVLVVLVLTFLPYQWILSYAALRAVFRQVRGIGNWEKTRHVGAHRACFRAVDPPPPVVPASGGSALPLLGEETHVRKHTDRPKQRQFQLDPVPPDQRLSGKLLRGRAFPQGLPFPVWGHTQRVLVWLSVITGACTHGYNLFGYPLYLTDEGIYMEQAWSVLREGRLSPYTYFYDHAPAGWLVIAGWVSVLPHQFQTFGNAINTGRVLMLLVHLASVYLLFVVTFRFSRSTMAAVLATFLFNCSPLAVFYQRQVLLDNLMVFWLLLSLFLATRNDQRMLTPMLSGLAFGVAVLTKENSIFFLPIVGYLVSTQVRQRRNHRFAIGFWYYCALAVTSLYFLAAALNNELFPSHFNFDLHRPPTDHVSLLYTIWWQLHRNQANILDPHSYFWSVMQGVWLPKDGFLLGAGCAAMLINLALGLHGRSEHRGQLIAAGLAASYTYYLIRGSMMLEFYVVPLLPFLAMNIGMLTESLFQPLWKIRGRVAPLALQGVGVAVLFTALWSPMGHYFLVREGDGKVVPHDLYKLSLNELEAQELAFIRQHIPPDARIIMDDDLWVDLHDGQPSYQRAYSHWKAAADPAVRDTVFARDWRHIDYLIVSNKMLDAMDRNNGDGSEDWIFEALNHAQQIWDRQLGDIELQIYQIKK